MNGNLCDIFFHMKISSGIFQYLGDIYLLYTNDISMAITVPPLAATFNKIM